MTFGLSVCGGSLIKLEHHRIFLNLAACRVIMEVLNQRAVFWFGASLFLLKLVLDLWFSFDIHSTNGTVALGGAAKQEAVKNKPLLAGDPLASCSGVTTLWRPIVEEPTQIGVIINRLFGDLLSSIPKQPSEQPSQTPSEQPAQPAQPLTTPEPAPNEQPSQTPNEQPSQTPSEMVL